MAIKSTIGDTSQVDLRKTEQPGLKRSTIVFGVLLLLAIGLWVAANRKIEAAKPPKPPPPPQAAKTTGDRIVRAYPGYWTEAVEIPSGSCFGTRVLKPEDTVLVEATHSDKTKIVVEDNQSKGTDLGIGVTSLRFKSKMDHPVEVRVKFR